MSRILLLDSEEYRWNLNSPILRDGLIQAGFSVDLVADHAVLSDDALRDYDTVILGGGFTKRTAPGADTYEPQHPAERTDALLRFVDGGGGFIGIHAAGWGMGGEFYSLIGGHANFHPPRWDEPFRVEVLPSGHPAMDGVESFEISDEIYIAAFDPAVTLLATAEWLGKAHPVAWAKAYGSGRVFYTSLGHAPIGFEQPGYQRMIAAAAHWTSARG